MSGRQYESNILRIDFAASTFTRRWLDARNTLLIALAISRMDLAKNERNQIAQQMKRIEASQSIWNTIGRTVSTEYRQRNPFDALVQGTVLV